MKQAPKIVKILEVEPFKIRTLWSNGEERMHDFTTKLPLFDQYERWKPLTDPERFKEVAIGQGDTLCWPRIQPMNSQGEKQSLAFDPDVLYAESELVEPSPIIQIDSNREFTQAAYARRHHLEPSKVRTWVRRGKLKTRYVPHLDIVLVIEEGGLKTFQLTGKEDETKKAGRGAIKAK